MSVLLFKRWDFSEVDVKDPGLKKYINLQPIILPKTTGKYGTVSIHKAKMNVVERFINKLFVPGHKGKKHKLTSGHIVGNYQGLFKAVKESFDIIEKRMKNNPVQVLVNAIENGALYEEVMGYRLGGIIARKSVVVSPQRRLDLSLRLITQDIFSKSFKSRKTLAQVIADDLIEIAGNDQRNNVIRERNRIEREAEGAR
ncbi:MAG: 30S ribosomal protein S7 [Candidatus Aenigmarchaeota archaeon]|nr:30S ribosomal protein S7 [Candidatus Aenigmarchaeota archaeon]MCK4531439.1 30S ribosomal protein S7 [Candidatus Aenigmarchaeota archaeon]